MLRSALLATVSVVILATGSTASAQTSPASANGTTLGEIVVTANRREQKLQDVGISVAAISGVQLRDKGLSSSTDLLQLTPGIYASGSLAGQSQQFTIRGVTQSDFNDAIEAPVAVYVDDIYMTAPQGQTMALFDVARVEILKGPQGTLFGRNATGGLVNTLVVEPELHRYGGYLDANYGRFNEAKVEGAVNLPLGENAAVRLSGYYGHIDNYWKNRYPAGVAPGSALNFGPAGPSPCCQDEGGNSTYAGRLQIKWEPTDRLRIRLTGQAAEQDLSTAPYTVAGTIGTFDAQGRLIQSDRVSPTETRLGIGPDGGNYTNFGVIPFAGIGSPSGQRVPGATWFGYVPLDPDHVELSSDYALRRLNVAQGAMGAIHLDYDLGGAQLTSITGYQRFKKQFLMDGDGSPNNLFLFGTKADTRAVSQEVRLSGKSADLRWQAGVYYLDIDAHTTQGLLGPKGSLYSMLFGLAATGVDGVDVLRLKTQSGSLFGQVEYDFAPKWTIILGGRLIREHQDYTFSSFAALNTDDYAVDDQVALFPLAPPYANKRTKTLWAGKAQLEYRPQEHLLIYAGVNRSVKGGSYNAPAPDGSPPLSPSQMAYGPETLINYEGGFKYGTSRFSVNGSAFYYDYRDYQAFLFENASGFVQNVNSKVYGLEGEIGAQLTDDLRMTLAGSYTHAEIKNFEVAPGVERTVRPTYAPRVQVNADLTYVAPTEIYGGRVTFDAQANYASGFYHNLRNFNSDWFSGRTLLNLNANWSQGPTGLRLGVYAENLLDKRYGVIGFDSTALFGGNIESFGKPRTFGGRIGYTF
ncbi:MAG TPA: TonB-dependent receptor [Phenylobacterium sp.]|uniref:TonB-dependent receptor n=1 Tax=Phenylobacterium sp. TaxID=1871053 RepID=UPI002B49B11E|nr:TonB-dependent receptor [Phenylobacterium sp.]HKR90382.1 TonB-dependent receptor [Phenylobacterium sp.]